MKAWMFVLCLVWVLRWFGTADELLHFLNTLPLQRQQEAKIIVAPSSRNIGGWVGSPYGLVYREGD